MYIPRNNLKIKNLSAQNSSATAFQTVFNSGEVNDLPGTSISFTPDSNSTNVVYEFWLQGCDTASGWGNVNTFELYENTGSGFSAMGNGFKIRHIYYRPWQNNVFYGKFILNSYSGSRTYKLTTTTNHNYYRTFFYEDEAGNHVDPIVIMYDIV